MALINRFTRLFRADMHAVLDRMEEPDVVLRQAIREMEDEIARNAQQLKACELERQHGQARLAAIQQNLQSIAGELDLCFAANNEALVRTLLRRRLEGERMAKHLEQRLRVLDQRIETQRKALDEQRRRLDDMRQKAALFDVEPRHDECDEAPRWGAEDLAVSDADVDLALLRERQQRRTP